MFARRINLDSCYVENHNYQNKERMEFTIRMALKYATDPEKKLRREHQQCPVCFYAESHMAGAAMTSRQCGACDEVLRSSSTHIDCLCVPCAERSNLCRTCGADIDLKDRRKRDLTKTPIIEELQ